MWQLSQLVIETPVSVAYGMCVADLPSAGGNAPLWQLAQLFAATVCVWLKVVGFHEVTLWQATQLVAATGTWVALLPVAALPLWQLLQFVAAVNVLWSTFAKFQSVVDLWQFSHTVWPVWMAVLGLPTAGGKVPVWQVAHCVLIDTALWNLAGVHAA